ncbi:hypothetical protein C7E17_14775, partial [Stenotrophomonas maltophilia]
RAAAKVPAARLQAVREAVGSQQRLKFGYEDAHGQRSERIVWPFALGYFDEVPMLAAWCERREDFRHFRLDRIRQARVLEDHYLVPRATLLRRWQKAQGIAPDRLMHSAARRWRPRAERARSASQAVRTRRWRAVSASGDRPSGVVSAALKRSSRATGETRHCRRRQ